MDASAAYKAKDYQRAAALFAQVAREREDRPARCTTTARRSSRPNRCRRRRRSSIARRSKADPEVRYRARFNCGIRRILVRGLAAHGGLRRGPSSIRRSRGYKKVLIQRPTDLDAKWNYELALRRRSRAAVAVAAADSRTRRSRRRRRSRSRSRRSRNGRPSSCWAAPSARSARCRARSSSRTARSHHQAARTGEARVLVGLALLAQLAITAQGPDTATACLPLTLTRRRTRAGRVPRRRSSRRVGRAPAPALACRFARRARRRRANERDHRRRRPTSRSRRSDASRCRPSSRRSTRSARSPRRSVVTVREPIDPPPGRARRRRGSTTRTAANARLARSSGSRWTTRSTCCSTRGRAADYAETRPSFRRRWRRCWRTTSTSRAAADRMGAGCFETLSYRRALFPLFPGRVAIPPAVLTYSLPLSSSFFSREESFELRSDSVRFVAVEPPAAGRPRITPARWARCASARARESPTTRVGDAVVLTVRVNAVGNVKLLPRPIVELSWAIDHAGRRARRDRFDGEPHRGREGVRLADHAARRRHAGRAAHPLSVLRSGARPIRRHRDVADPVVVAPRLARVERHGDRDRTCRSASSCATSGATPFSTRPLVLGAVRARADSGHAAALLAAPAHRGRRSSPIRRLRALAEAPRPPPARELRRLFVESLRERVPARGPRSRAARARAAPRRRERRRRARGGGDARATRRRRVLRRAARSTIARRAKRWRSPTWSIARRSGRAAPRCAPRARSRCSLTVVATRARAWTRVRACSATACAPTSAASSRSPNAALPPRRRAEAACRRRVGEPRRRGVGERGHGAGGARLASRAATRSARRRDARSARARSSRSARAAAAYVAPLAPDARRRRWCSWRGSSRGWCSRSRRRAARAPRDRSPAARSPSRSSGSSGCSSSSRGSSARDLGVLVHEPRAASRRPRADAPALATAAAGEAGRLGAREGGMGLTSPLDAARAGWVPASALMPIEPVQPARLTGLAPVR